MIGAGLIDFIVGGPPCATWSMVRHLPGGPRPLRLRGEQTWGRSDLRAGERAQVVEANILMINFLSLCETIHMAGGFFLMEHPGDPGVAPYASIFATALFVEFAKRTGAVLSLIDQCMYGGSARKKTGLAHTIPGLRVGLRCSGDHVHGTSHGRDEFGLFHTRKLQSYPPGLCDWIAWAIMSLAWELVQYGRKSKHFQLGKIRCGDWAWEGTSTDDIQVSSINDKFTMKEPILLAHNRPAVYVHVDDGVVLSTGRSHLCSEIMHKLADGLEDIGFEVNDRQDHTQVTKAIGFAFKQNPAEFLLPAKKMTLLQQALEWLIQAPTVDTCILRSVLGIWVWASSLCRCELAIAGTIFQFVNNYYPYRATWWPVVIREMEILIALVPALRHQLFRPTWPVVFATDAEGANNQDCGGFGVVATATTLDVAMDTITSSKRAGFTVAKMDGSLNALKNPEKELKACVPVTQVPRSVLAADRQWVDIVGGRWKHNDHITLGEGRGTLVLLERLASMKTSQGHIFSSLCDNMPWCGATNKGRSPAFRVNRLLRRRAAIMIAKDFVVIHPWTDTHSMPADELSRRK
jgi:hypothetical protein